MSMTELLDQCALYTRVGLRNYGYVTTEDLVCHEINGAVITTRTYSATNTFTGAVYDGHGKLIGSTLRFNEGDIVPADPQHIDDIDRISAVSKGGLSIYGGILFPILGHFLLESLARLWPLLWDRSKQPAPPPVYFHHWPSMDFVPLMNNPLFRASFAAFGLDTRNVHVIDGPVQFERLLVAQPASVYHRQLDRRMVDVFGRIRAHILVGRFAGRSGRKLFLSRSRWAASKRILNEDAIDTLMQDRGFEVVHTQSLSPAELMTQLAQASTVVASDGSHAHMLAFCDPGIRVIMLDTRPVPSQFAISALGRFDALHIPLFTNLKPDEALNIDLVGGRLPLHWQLQSRMVDLTSLKQLFDQVL